jgi:hypothetical protein
MSYDYQDAYNAAIGTVRLGPGEKPPMSGVPVWERGQFSYGAGPFAPGGPGGGMTIGPRQYGGPGSCPQVSGGNLVCVQPPMTEKGVETGRGWPPEIGPQEEQMMEVGCVATGRRCGGSPRAPAQYWCCPSAGGMPMPFIGTPFPTTSGGLGDVGFGDVGVVGSVVLGIVGLAGAWIAMNLITGEGLRGNPQDWTLVPSTPGADDHFDVIYKGTKRGEIMQTGSKRWYAIPKSTNNPVLRASMVDAAEYVVIRS